MRIKRGNLVIATFLAMFSFLTVAYFSCSKPGAVVACTGSFCQNGGYCTVDSVNKKLTPTCTCPTGYEGTTCATPSAPKYFGTWTVLQVITGSDSTAYIGDSSIYPLYLVASSTPTTFIINNFYNNPFYNNIVCTLDSTNSANFMIDTISAFHMVYNHFIMRGGWGNIRQGSTISKDTINAILMIEFKNQTSNWEMDTVQFVMYNHQT